MSENAHGWSKDQVVALLEKVDLFVGLPAEDIRAIAEIVGSCGLVAHEILFQEGQPGDSFYVVRDGAVEIIKARPDGSEERLAVRRAGEAFGEMALLNTAPRSATARALESTKLLSVGRDDFERLLGGNSPALRMLQQLSKALRSLGVRFANAEVFRDLGRTRTDVNEISRVIQAGLLPRSAPRVQGFDVAAGTTTEEAGRGGTAWDWMTLRDGRTVLVTFDVRQDGFPPAHHVGVARAVLRGLAADVDDIPVLMAKANEALAAASVEGVGQYVELGVLATGDGEVEWASAGRVPGGMIRREGSFEEFGAHGPPLGMMGGFKYNAQRFTMSSGDTAFVLSHGSSGLFLGAADLVAQLHGKPAGEVVSTLHKAIRKAQGSERHETSVLYARRH